MKEKRQGGGQAALHVAQSGFEKAVVAAKLTPAVGKSAVDGKYRGHVTAKAANTKFTGSVDMDGAFAKTEPRANRWDYGLGLLEPGQAERAVWVEPHSGGSTGEVKTMLAKLAWLEAKLELPAFSKLKALTQQTRKVGKRPFHWLASGKVSIRAGTREANMLAVSGLDLPASHLEL